MVIEGDFVAGRRRADRRSKPVDGLQRLRLPVDRRLADRRSSAAATSSSCSRTRPAARGVRRVPGDAGGGRGLGQARRLLVAEQERRHERVPGRDHAATARRDRRGGDVPLRHVRPAAGRVRRHGGPGRVEDPPGLPGNPSDVDGITQQLEAAAAKAYELGGRCADDGHGDRRRQPPSRGLPPDGRTGRWQQLRRRCRVPRAGARPARRLARLPDDLDDQPQLLRPRAATTSSGSTTTRTLFTTTTLRTAIKNNADLGARRAGARHGDRPDLRGADRADPLVGRVQDRSSSCRWRSRCSPPASSGG